MQKLTMKGYLSGYVKYLSGLNTNSIKKLAGEAKTNHRLREPLFLYACCTNKVDLLLDYTKGSDLGGKYANVAMRFDFPEILTALDTENTLLSEGYQKCYNSYKSCRDMVLTHNRKKLLMHNKIKELQHAKNITAYRIYTDLKLNASNVNAFIKHGSVDKLSVDKVRMILQYLENV